MGYNGIAPLHPNELPAIEPWWVAASPDSRLRELTERIRTKGRERAAAADFQPDHVHGGGGREHRREPGGRRLWRLRGSAEGKLETGRIRRVATRAADLFSKGFDDGGKKKATAAAPKFNAKTGVSDKSLIDDLFS